MHDGNQRKPNDKKIKSNKLASVISNKCSHSYRGSQRHHTFVTYPHFATLKILLKTIKYIKVSIFRMSNK